MTEIDPTTLRPMAGKAIVKIIEVLGGTTDGGLFVPGTTQDHSGKDTFYGEMLCIGPAPALAHYKSGPGPGWDVRPNDSGKCWPDELMAGFKEGDIYVFPRDVEMAFAYKNQRFAIVHLHEAILAIAREEFDEAGFEFVPWRPPVQEPQQDNRSTDELLDELEEELLS